MSDEDKAIATVPTALAIPMPGGSLVPDWWAKAFGPTTMYKTTLDLSVAANRTILLAALNEDGNAAGECLNLTLDIVGYTISPASRIVDGEIQEWVRCVLHCADGENVVCGSMGVVKSLMLLQTLVGPAPWNPPLKKQLRSKQVGGGKHWYSLVDPPPKQAAAKPAK